MQETQVQFLGRKDPTEKEMATHSRILAWEIPGTEEPGRLQSMESQRVGHDLGTEHVWFPPTHKITISYTIFFQLIFKGKKKSLQTFLSIDYDFLSSSTERFLPGYKVN